MKVTDPQSLLEGIDVDRWNSLRGAKPSMTQGGGLLYVEPGFADGALSTASGNYLPRKEESLDLRVEGKIQKLGDFIDTDAVSQIMVLSNLKTDI